MPPLPPIVIGLNGSVVTVNPDQQRVPPGTHEIVWQPAQGIEITGIAFSGNPPITKPQPQSNGRWSAMDSNPGTVEQRFPYTVTAKPSAGSRPSSVDPEIINDPGGINK